MKTALISLALLAAAPVFANEAADEQFNRQSFTSVATRAEVQQQFLAAREAGTLPVTSEAASLLPPAAFGVTTRAEVRQQYLDAREAGALPVTSEAASLLPPAESSDGNDGSDASADTRKVRRDDLIAAHRRQVALLP